MYIFMIVSTIYICWFFSLNFKDEKEEKEEEEENFKSEDEDIEVEEKDNLEDEFVFLYEADVKGR